MKKIAVLFPGQGTQAGGMGKDLYDAYPAAKAVFDEADSLLGFPFSKNLFHNDSIEIMDTEITQVAIFLTSVAYYKVFVAANDILPDSFAGHSVGEYAALVCSGAMRFEDGLSLIRKRGQLMQEVSDRMADGGMLAVIGLTYEEVLEVTENCKRDGIDVSISTYNDIRQIVVSGRKGALNSAKDRLEDAGARTKMLEVKTAFHNPCMNEIIDRMKELIDGFDISLPKGKVYCNVTGKPYASAEEIYEYLPVQVSECVRFYDICNAMSEDEIDIFIEAGRGKVLSNLLLKNRRGDYELYPLGDISKRELFIDRVSRGIDFGRLNLLGSICGELISVPDYYAEAEEKLYRNAGNELEECIKNGKFPKSVVLADYIDEFLAMAEGITDKQSDKWREYAEYFRTEVTGNE